MVIVGLRNRFRLADPVISSNRQEAADDLVDEEEDAARPWTTLDWIILAVKLLIWFTFQVIFAKVGFLLSISRTSRQTLGEGKQAIFVMII